VVVRNVIQKNLLDAAERLIARSDSMPVVHNDPKLDYVVRQSMTDGGPETYV